MLYLKNEVSVLFSLTPHSVCLLEYNSISVHVSGNGWNLA